MGADPAYWLDEMDSCRVHGVAAMRHTPVDGETPRNLDHWACSQCGFRPSDIDWVAEMRMVKAIGDIGCPGLDDFDDREEQG